MGLLALTTKANEVSWAQAVDLGTSDSEYTQVAAICKAISLGDSRASHLVAFNGIAKHLPALQIFFRTNHFRVLSYSCVDELPEGRFAEWPDAPVIYFDTQNNQDNLKLARLRNWEVVSTTQAELQNAIISSVESFE